MTVTTAEVFAEPPGPVHVNVKVLVVAVSAALLAEPAVARLPLHAPLAVQAVALRDDHVNAVVAPLATVVGIAVSVTVGVGVAFTITDTDWLAEPPWPMHIKV